MRSRVALGEALAGLAAEEGRQRAAYEAWRALHDLRLAERLGFERPRAIRQLIERNREDLETTEGCHTL